MEFGVFGKAENLLVTSKLFVMAEPGVFGKAENLPVAPQGGTGRRLKPSRMKDLGCFFARLRRVSKIQISPLRSLRSLRSR